MEKQLEVAVKSKDLMEAQEIAAMLKALPEKDRLRLEGVIIGVGMMHIETTASPPIRPANRPS